MEPLPARACADCTFDVPIDSEHCPHCARPSLFPNVAMAQLSAQTYALHARFDAVMQRRNPASAAVVQAFLRTVGTDSKAVIARPSAEVYQLLVSDNRLYASFHALVKAAARLPSGDGWDLIREVVDAKLFPYFKEKIHFAALTLSGSGLSAYGDCFMFLRDDMIRHRSTVFEDNSIVFFDKNNLRVTEPIPPGHSATWEDRGKLAAAKHGHEIDEHLRPEQFPALILRHGANAAGDCFIEVHIFGSISIKSVAWISIDGRKSSGNRSSIRLRAMREKLTAQRVKFVERQTA